MSPEAYLVLYDEILKLIETHWQDEVPEKIQRPVSRLFYRAAFLVLCRIETMYSNMNA